MNKLKLLPKFVYAEIYFIVWSFNKFSFALGTISKIIINIELNKLKDIKYLNPVTLNVKYLYIYLINKKRTDSFVWRNQSFGRSLKSSIKMCYYSAFSIKRIPSVPTSKVAFPFTTGIGYFFNYNYYFENTWNKDPSTTSS